MKKVALQYLRKHSPLRSKVRDGCHDLDISQETGPNKRKAIEEMNNSKNSQTPKRYIEHKTKKQSVANIRIIVPMTVPIFVCSIFLPYSLSTSIFNYWFVLFFHNKTFVSMSIKKKSLDIHTLFSSDVQVGYLFLSYFHKKIYSNIHLEHFSNTTMF